MGVLILLRHGESQWNLENRFTGWVDVDLSPKGEQEAKEAGEKLKPYRFDRVYTSVLKRAVRTMEIALEYAGNGTPPVVKHEALNERHYGDLQGLNKAETAKQYGGEQVHIWRRSYDIPPPNGESLKDTAARVLPYWESAILPDVQSGKNILVAAHGNSLRSLVMRIDGISAEEIPNLNIPTGVPLLYEYESESLTNNGYIE